MKAEGGGTFLAKPGVILFFDSLENVSITKLTGYFRQYKELATEFPETPLRVSAVAARMTPPMVTALIGGGRNFAEITLPAEAFCRRKKW